MKTKKGSVFDIPIIIIMIFLVATTLVIAYFFSEKLTTPLKQVAQEQNIVPEVINNTASKLEMGIKAFDITFIFVMFGIYLFLAVSTFLLDTHPVFLIITVIVFIAFFMLTPILSNAYESMVTADSELAQKDAQLVVVPYVIKHLPIFILVGFFILLISLYAKSRWVTQ